MSWKVSEPSASVMEEPHFVKSDGFCGHEDCGFGGADGKQRTDLSQAHLKPVMQPRGSGGLAAMVLKLLLKHLPSLV